MTPSAWRASQTASPAAQRERNSKPYRPMLAYSGPELWSIFVMQSFAGLSLFSVLLLMALGLAIIFGQMGVVNLAHGEFMALGAYTVYLCSQIVQNHAPALQPYYFIIAIAVAFFAAALVGWLVEWSLSHGPRYAACVTSPITLLGPYFALNASTNFLLLSFSRLWKYLIAE
jgi:branched-subunit amino acid ABC-type transport system permease component